MILYGNIDDIFASAVFVSSVGIITFIFDSELWYRKKLSQTFVLDKWSLAGSKRNV